MRALFWNVYFSEEFAISCSRIRLFSLTDLPWFENVFVCSKWFSMARFIDSKSGISSVSAPRSHLTAWKPFSNFGFSERPRFLVCFCFRLMPQYLSYA
jgi:hypothetical protein